MASQGSESVWDVKRMAGEILSHELVRFYCRASTSTAELSSSRSQNNFLSVYPFDTFVLTCRDVAVLPRQ